MPDIYTVLGLVRPTDKPELCKCGHPESDHTVDGGDCQHCKRCISFWPPSHDEIIIEAPDFQQREASVSYILNRTIKEIS